MVDAPNGELAKYGVTRETKRRALEDLEGAGVIRVDRQDRKTPQVTLL
jgi:DNA-binding GntR family transcriptional regulator